MAPSSRRPRRVVAALSKAIGRGTSYGAPTEAETQLAGVKDPGPPLEDVFWALLNSREFLFNH